MIPQWVEFFSYGCLMLGILKAIAIYNNLTINSKLSFFFYEKEASQKYQGQNGQHYEQTKALPIFFLG
jgi:hypothetical protein